MRVKTSPNRDETVLNKLFETMSIANERSWQPSHDLAPYLVPRQQFCKLSIVSSSYVSVTPRMCILWSSITFFSSSILKRSLLMFKWLSFICVFLCRWKFWFFPWNFHFNLFLKTNEVWSLTLSKPGFFWAPKTKGGGGGTLCPPSKNPVTLLRIHSSKLFLKACPKMNLLTQLWFPWKPWLGF